MPPLTMKAPKRLTDQYLAFTKLIISLRRISIQNIENMDKNRNTNVIQWHKSK